MDKLNDAQLFDRAKHIKELYTNNVSYAQATATVVEQPQTPHTVLCKSCASHCIRGGCYCKWGQHNKKNREHDEICTNRNHLVECKRYVSNKE